MNDEELLQSKVIDFLRFPMIIGIVMLHAFLESIKGLEIPVSGVPVYHFLSFFISRVLVYVAVPLFFLISGYLFFYRTEFSLATYKKKLKTRVRTLLVPYLFWNIVVLAGHWSMALFSPVELASGAYKLVSDYIWSDYLLCFWNINGAMPVNGVLWFIRDLMIMMVCAPLVYWGIRYFRWYLLVIVGGIWMTGATWEIPQMSAVFFFSLGAWFSINGRNFVADFKCFCPWGVMLYLIYGVATVGTRGTAGFVYVSNAGILAGIVAVVALTYYFVKNGKWRVSAFLMGSCFLVYAFHQLPLNVLDRILFRGMHPDEDWQFVLIYLAGPVLIVFMDLLLYALLRRFFPRFAAVITGGRS